MPQHHTTGDQVNFVGEWFSTWSEMQRADFLPVLVKEMKPQGNHVNGGLPEDFNALNLNSSNRPPSIFHCQVKLFHDWVASWSAEEKSKLLDLFKCTDSEFMEKYSQIASDPKNEQSANGAEPDRPNEDAREEDAEAVMNEAQQAVAGAAAPVVANGNDQGRAAADSDIDEALESSPSSPLSSPRPSDGHPDSGMDSPVEGVGGEDEGGHAVVMDAAEEAPQEQNEAPLPEAVADNDGAANE